MLDLTSARSGEHFELNLRALARFLPAMERAGMLAEVPLLDVAEVHDAEELEAAARRSTRARI